MGYITRGKGVSVHAATCPIVVNLLFDPERTEDLAEATLRLLPEPGLRDRLARAALERSARFAWAESAELVEQSFLRTVRGD